MLISFWSAEQHNTPWLDVISTVGITIERLLLVTQFETILKMIFTTFRQNIYGCKICRVNIRGKRACGWSLLSQKAAGNITSMIWLELQKKVFSKESKFNACKQNVK